MTPEAVISYDEGETFSVRKDVADPLLALDYVDQTRAPRSAGEA
ncbi:hypothetical protein [Caulobacter segnis]